MDDQRRTQLVMEAIGHVIDRDAQRGARILEELGANSDGYQMFGVCCALAEAAKHILPKIFGPQPPGTMWALEELTPGAMLKDPTEAFATRFIVAWANDDRKTCMALYNAAFDASNDEYVTSVTKLLAIVGDFARLALELKDKGELRG